MNNIPTTSAADVWRRLQQVDSEYRRDLIKEYMSDTHQTEADARRALGDLSAWLCGSCTPLTLQDIMIFLDEKSVDRVELHRTMYGTIGLVLDERFKQLANGYTPEHDLHVWGNKNEHGATIGVDGLMELASSIVLAHSDPLYRDEIEADPADDVEKLASDLASRHSTAEAAIISASLLMAAVDALRYNAGYADQRSDSFMIAHQVLSVEMKTATTWLRKTCERLHRILTAEQRLALTNEWYQKSDPGYSEVSSKAVSAWDGVDHAWDEAEPWVLIYMLQTVSENYPLLRQAAAGMNA